MVQIEFSKKECKNDTLENMRFTVAYLISIKNKYPKLFIEFIELVRASEICQ